MNKRIFTKHGKAIDVQGLKAISPIINSAFMPSKEDWGFLMTYSDCQLHVGHFETRKECENCRNALIKFWVK